MWATRAKTPWAPFFSTLVSVSAQASWLGGPIYTMPNGHRESYRVGPSSPSLSHSSDSSDTLENKALYWDLALWVCRRWICRVLFRRRHRARRERRLLSLVAVRRGITGPAYGCLVPFISHPEAVCFRGLPLVDRVGLCFDSPPHSPTSDNSASPAGFAL